MRKLIYTLLLSAPLLLSADSESGFDTNSPFHNFTGQVQRNKVRLRLSPTLDSEVVRELAKNDMVVVAGETEDFYAVLPPQGVKAYIFRTFVLDDVVEGTKVNVRLEPSVDAPIIAQLNTGDKVKGAVSPLNAKWLEIQIPSSARFWVAKDYIQKIGDASLMATLSKRKEENNLLLSNTYLVSQEEMQKSFPEIHLEGIIKNYNRIIDQAKDFPEEATRAKEHLKTLQENYLKKKIAYLEAKAAQADGKLANLPPASFIDLSNRSSLPSKMSLWNDQETFAYQEWLEENPDQPIESFYLSELQNAKLLQGTIEPYTKAVKNKPGDYVLVSQTGHGVIAYLYSNKVNLEDYVGQTVTLKGGPRPNHNFAFPAYFVLDIVN
ncbi:MAG: hypothetical protein KDK62_03365 [Chlamydiia bacterium]|nr:hypothetical protein [Chlamydiia bacterium]